MSKALLSAWLRHFAQMNLRNARYGGHQYFLMFRLTPGNFRTVMSEKADLKLNGEYQPVGCRSIFAGPEHLEILMSADFEREQIHLYKVTAEIKMQGF